MKRRVRIPAALLAVTGLVLLLTPPGAGAATLEATGWWWRAQSASLPAPLPPPPDVSPDQLLVQGQPEGATAVAAVRYTLNEGEEAPVLTIKPAEGSTVPDTALILACRVVVPWEPAQAGAWEAQPLVDCATSVQGVISPDGVTFAVAPLQSGPSVDVLIVPGRDPAGPPGANGSAFSLKFARPGPEALMTSPGSTSTGGSFTPSDTPSGSDSASGGAIGSEPTVSSPAFAGSSGENTAPLVTPAAEAALPPQRQASPGATGFSPQSGIPAAAADDDNETRTRTLGFLVLVAGAGLLFWSSSGAGTGGAGERIGLGRFAREAPAVVPTGVPPTTGGLGRYAKARTAPPPRLS